MLGYCFATVLSAAPTVDEVEGSTPAITVIARAFWPPLPKCWEYLLGGDVTRLSRSGKVIAQPVDHSAGGEATGHKDGDPDEDNAPAMG